MPGLDGPLGYFNYSWAGDGVSIAGGFVSLGFDGTFAPSLSELVDASEKRKSMPLYGPNDPDIQVAVSEHTMNSLMQTALSHSDWS